jgi:hypothetical protein
MYDNDGGGTGETNVTLLPHGQEYINVSSVAVSKQPEGQWNVLIPIPAQKYVTAKVTNAGYPTSIMIIGFER